MDYEKRDPGDLAAEECKKTRQRQTLPAKKSSAPDRGSAIWLPVRQNSAGGPLKGNLTRPNRRKRSGTPGRERGAGEFLRVRGSCHTPAVTGRRGVFTVGRGPGSTGNPGFDASPESAPTPDHPL